MIVIVLIDKSIQLAFNVKSNAELSERQYEWCRQTDYTPSRIFLALHSSEMLKE
jgi:hypothetical protein